MCNIVYGEDVVKYWPAPIMTGYDYRRVEVLVFGDNPASATYVKNKEKQCIAHGVECITHYISVHPTDYCNHWAERAEEIIRNANEDKNVVGIMVQLPLPQKCATYEQKLIDLIKPEKDIDGLTTTNIGKLLTVDLNPYHTPISVKYSPVTVPKDMRIPATARGIMKILQYIDGGYSGKKAVVVGRSNIVGRPIALLLDRVYNMTVTVLHSKSKDIESYLKDADVVITAIGKPEYIKGDMLKKGAIVIDAGTTYVEKDGKRVLVGDVDFDSASTVCSAITPVPKGVGVVTVHSLIHNILDPLNIKDGESGYKL